MVAARSLHELAARDVCDPSRSLQLPRVTRAYFHRLNSRVVLRNVAMNSDLGATLPRGVLVMRDVHVDSGRVAVRPRILMMC